MKPAARRSGILVERLPKELILYDKASDRVHCLSEIAAVIWENCDGNKSEDDLARLVEARLRTPADRQVVLQGLEELEKAGLLEAGHDLVSSGVLTSRRDAVGKIAMAGSALVATIAAPAPVAHASSGKPDPPPPPIRTNPPDPPPKGPNPPRPKPPVAPVAPRGGKNKR
jgi:hypothetical protein